MKVVFFATYYDQYLINLYKKNPQAASLSYDQQLAFLLSDFFGVFGSYYHYANELGAQAHLIIANCEPLQRAWAKENGVAFTENWKYEVAFEQVKKIKPDVFFIGSMFNYYGRFIDEIKPYCKRIMGWISCPIPENVVLDQFSLILTSAPQYVDMFRHRNINSERILPAFDTRLLQRINKSEKKMIDFSFVGTLSGFHQNRNHYLKQLSRETDIQLYGIYDQSKRRKLKDFVTNNPIAKRHQGEVFGVEMYNTLASSRITFNIHIDFVGNYAANMRLFEATGCGALLLTDQKQNLGDIFKIDSEAVSYCSPEEAIEKVSYYLRNESERIRIAEAGQKRTINDYNYCKNVEEILFLFNKYF